MNTIELFKTDLWNGIWKQAKASWKPLIVPLITAGILLTLVFAGFASYIMSILPEDILSGFDPTDQEAVMAFVVSIAELLEQNALAVGIASIVFGIVLSLITAWASRVCLQISQDVVEVGAANVGEIMSNSFDNLFKNVLVYSVLLAVISGILSVAITPLQHISNGLHSVVNLIINILMLRLIIVNTAIVIGKMEIRDAISFSWENITFGRAIKIILIAIVAAILGGLATFLLIAILGLLGIVGGILAIPVMLFVSLFAAAIYYSGVTGAFYRYAEVEYSDSEDHHLIDEE